MKPLPRSKWRVIRISSAILAATFAAGIISFAGTSYQRRFQSFSPHSSAPPVTPPVRLSKFQQAVLADLDRQCAARIVYQDGYFTGGEPPPKIGVCTDVVLRSYRAAGVDLTKMVTEDIARHRMDYRISHPDPNIDQRRCRNLTVFFQRRALTLPTSGKNADWEPGDIVFWDTRGDGQVDHVGVIANHRDASGVPTVTHHWPGQVVAEMDWLYRLPTLRHYRWKSTSG